MSNFPRPTKEDAAKLNDADLDLIAQGRVYEVKHDRNREELPMRKFACDLTHLIISDPETIIRCLKQSIFELGGNVSATWYRDMRFPWQIIAECEHQPANLLASGMIWHEIS